jgi:hypothetical protein
MAQMRKKQYKTIAEIGEWTYKPELLWEKVVKGSPDECWTWKGSQSSAANLFGAKKNGLKQMIQANRLIYAAATGLDPAEFEVYHSCGNRFCTNSAHFLTRLNRFVKDKE